MRVLVLEDDPKVRRSLCCRLRGDGNAVDEAGTIEEAASALIDAPYDCLVLDRLVPGGDGLDLVVGVLAEPDPPATLVLTAIEDQDDRVRAFEAGVDDYVVKPVRPMEVVLRVRRLLAQRAVATPEPVQLGRAVVDRARHEVTIDGDHIHLTPVQYAVLDYLVVNRLRLVETEELLRHCWDRNRDLTANPLHTQICRLRKIFRGVLAFEKVHGCGYRLRVDEPEHSTDQPA